MKNTLFLTVLLLLGLFACQNDSGDAVREIRSGEGEVSKMVRNPVSAELPLDTNQLARISYFEPEFDFGTVDEGDVVEHTFKFKNTGKVPLTILNARSSCGCTVPEWSDEPIPPGGVGEINAKFNTTAKMHEQNKWITITANTHPNETKVLLKGMVNPKN
ncbi:MAG: DUF1573 domain-containing protein [Bacteroidetes bacterium]|nr:MAG: DUF1573 domain-containing protein [Bacteroidota bacterium]